MRYRDRKLVKDEINSRIAIARYGVGTGVRSSARIRKIADKAIRMHDRRHNDFAGGAIAIGIIKLIILPLLTGIVTNAVVGSLREKIIDPVLDKTIAACKKLIGVGPDTPIADVLFDSVISGIGTIIKFLRAEKSPAANKLQSAFDKIKGLK